MNPDSDSDRQVKIRRGRRVYTLVKAHTGFWCLFERLSNMSGVMISFYSYIPSEEKIQRDLLDYRSNETRKLLDDRASLPSKSASSNLGWRAWYWSYRLRCLVSPIIGTTWTTPDCSVDSWDDKNVLRGTQGIHARRIPRNWKRAGWHSSLSYPAPSGYNPLLVTGIVERYGRYVLGTTGWRAEHVVIRELMAQTTLIMLELMCVYPEVKIHLSPAATLLQEAS